jgi:hypothetical protein
MTDFQALELPIAKVKIGGPAVRALADRKEANDHHRVTAAEFRKSYQTVRPSLLNGLKDIGSKRY